MKKHSDKKVIYAALIGNSAIAVMKFIAAVSSGSAAMLAEGFHSTADSVNQIMLLIGHKRAARPPDEKHPFGYGKEIYFWAFVVAVSIFCVGAVLSIYEGVKKILHPELVKSLYLPLIVLGVSVIFEAYPWWVAYSEAKSLKSEKGFSGFLDLVVRSKNPTIMVVLLEDSAAMVGLFVAAIGISLAHVTGRPIFDAAASIFIGVVLFILALFIARETKALLIGESAGSRDRERIQQAICGVTEITSCGQLLTMHMGPEDILVNMEVEFLDDLSTDELETAIDKIEQNVKAAVPAVTKIYIEAQSLKKKPAKSKTLAE
ncbi:MAG: cation transporter [Desulfobacterales bacterium]|uniref:Cation transporter n=1 Tax=Candidatus Desulfatibia vada TaxID=2841696 RepID=A0A8J6TPW3_9BACT|nr:cation transporter [Candidatus Desulfatibia vada]